MGLVATWQKCEVLYCLAIIYQLNLKDYNQQFFKFGKLKTYLSFNQLKLLLLGRYHTIAHCRPRFFAAENHPIYTVERSKPLVDRNQTTHIFI